MAKKLSDYRDEEALILLADILEPALIIMQDEEFRDNARKRNEARAIKCAIKNHPKEVMEILAIYNGVEVKDFHCTIADVPKMVMEIIEDKALIEFFTSQGQKKGETTSGSATESTEESQK